MQNAFDLTVLTDAAGTITYASPAVLRVTGVSSQDVTGRAVASLVRPADAQTLGQLVARVARGAREQLPVELTVAHADGTTRDLDGTAVNLLGDPAVGAVVFNLRDVTERRRLESELAALAFHDPLTGLANRALLHERIGHAATRAARSPGHDAALVLIDLDDFKAVNDGLGHAEGDRLLVAVARRLESAMRSSDTVARLGGDEFVVFAESIGGREEACLLAQRVLDALEAPFAVGIGELPCRASVGLRLIAADELDATDLLRDADLAMYSAKAAGKGSWAMYESEMHDSASEQLALRSELHRALERDEFLMHYQPVIDVLYEKVVGFEALMRWEHPDRGRLDPDQFIALAETTGLIAPLGAWAIHEATAMLARTDAATGERELSISVNVSPVQLERGDVTAIVRDALQACDIEPQRLILEVTESVFLAETTHVSAQLEELRALGVRIALDDFGTGFSSLSYLERLPLDVLKIDRSFIASVAEDDGRGHIVAAVARLAAGLHLRTVAEGIETREQLVAVQALGCDHGQGYLISPPLPEEEATAFVFAPRLSR